MALEHLKNRGRTTSREIPKITKKTTTIDTQVNEPNETPQNQTNEKQEESVVEKKRKHVYRPTTPEFDYPKAARAAARPNWNSKEHFSGLYISNETKHDLENIIKEISAKLQKQGMVKAHYSKSTILHFLIADTLTSTDTLDNLIKKYKTWLINADDQD